MRVRELIEELKKMPEEKEVLYSDDLAQVLSINYVLNYPEAVYLGYDV